MYPPCAGGICISDIARCQVTVAHGRVASAYCYTHTCLDFFVDFQLLGFVCFCRWHSKTIPSQTVMSSKKDSSNIIQHVETKKHFLNLLSSMTKNHTKTKRVRFPEFPTLAKTLRRWFYPPGCHGFPPNGVLFLGRPTRWRSAARWVEVGLVPCSWWVKLWSNSGATWWWPMQPSVTWPRMGLKGERDDFKVYGCFKK